MLTVQTMAQKQPNRLKLISFAPAITAPATIIVIAACSCSEINDNMKANSVKRETCLRVHMIHVMGESEEFLFEAISTKLRRVGVLAKTRNSPATTSGVVPRRSTLHIKQLSLG